MAANIQQVYKERNSLVIAFVSTAIRALGLKGGVDTKQEGKTIVMLEVGNGRQVSWMCFAEEAAIARRVLLETDLKWDGTYLGTTNEWVEPYLDAAFGLEAPKAVPGGDELF